MQDISQDQQQPSRDRDWLIVRLMQTKCKANLIFTDYIISLLYVTCPWRVGWYTAGVSSQSSVLKEGEKLLTWMSEPVVVSMGTTVGSEMRQ